MSAKPPEPAAVYHGSTGAGGPGGGPGASGGLLHAFPSRPLTTDTIYNPSALYAAAAAAQAAYAPFGASDSSAFYPALNSEGVAAVEAWRNFSAAQTAAAAAAAWAYDPTLVSYPYGASYGALDVRRKNATRESTSTLKAWLYEHIKNPYPTKGEKIMLAIITKMTLTQVSTWFANARRRLKKENKMQWSPRNRTDNDDDDDDDDDKNSDDDDVERRARTNVDDCDEIDVGGVDDDDDDNHDRDFLRRRSPFTHFPVDVGSRDPFWDLQNRPQQGPRGLSNSDVPPTKSFAVTRDRESPQPVQQRPEKPRIWSLADVATSTTTPSSGRRSPPQPVDVAVRPPPLPLGAPTLSLPALPAGFQPWTNGVSGHHHRHPILPPALSASSSSPPVTHRPLPPVANGLLRYAPYPMVVGGGHPTSHAAVSHQLAAAAAAHAAAVNAAVQARLQSPISRPCDVSTPSAAVAVGRSLSPTPSNWPSIKNAPSIIICTDSENGESGKRTSATESSRNSSPMTASPPTGALDTGASQTAFKPVTPRRL